MTQLILTCEHAGNRVPTTYKPLFRDADEVLASHRGWDPGSLALGKTFQRLLAAPLFTNNVTRLLVETNRSVGHTRLFSEFTAGLDEPVKERILQQYYHQHRDQIETWIDEQTSSGHDVVHLSLHTFTPQLNGQTRNADVGLLYDPNRKTEKSICERWYLALRKRRPDLRIRRNYPYLGKTDGFTTYLRRRFPSKYVGIELEVNQLWPAQTAGDWRRLQRDLADSFAAAWQQS